VGEYQSERNEGVVDEMLEETWSEDEGE